MFSWVRLAARALPRHPLMALTTVVALAVGIGLATVGFAVMEVMLFGRLPFENGDRWVRMTPMTARDREPTVLAPGDYGRLAAAHGLEHFGAVIGSRLGVTLPGGRFDQVTTAALTPSTFREVPVAPLRGRLLTSHDAEPGQPRVVVLAERYWRRSLAADEAVVGGTVTIDAVPYTVVGVVAEPFAFPNTPDVWMPLDERFRSGARAPDSDARLFGIRSAGVSLTALAAEATAFAAQLETANHEPVTIDVTAFTDLGPMAGDLSTAIVLAVTLVLLVIAANVGNLVLARSFARSREFALRSALGASRGRLVGQVAAEVLLLGGIAALLGAVAGQAVLRQFNAMAELPFWVDFRSGPITVVLVIGATLVATLVAGAWPAYRATRRDLLQGLQGAGLRSSGVRFGRVAGAMVIVQIAVSIVMLHGAIIVAQGFRDYSDIRFDLPYNVLTMGVPLHGVTVGADGTRSRPLTARDAEAVAAGLPGVMSVGVSTALPRHSPAPRLVRVEGADSTTASSRLAPSAKVTPNYFDALGSRASAGRAFLDTDLLPGAQPVVIVNEPFVQRMLGGESAIGQRLRVIENGQPGPWREIVGVVPDLGLSVGDRTLAAGFYEPLTGDDNVVFLALRVNGDPLAYAEPLRRALHDQAPDVAPYRAERLDQVASEDLAFFAGFSSALLGIGVVTLVLALVGVYSMMAIIVARRTHEIGVRLALGAPARHIVHTIAGRAALQVGLGGVAGAILAVFSLMGRSVLVSRLGDGGRWTLPVVLGLLCLAGLGATWVPIRRALAVRPQDSLRAQ